MKPVYWYWRAKGEHPDASVLRKWPMTEEEAAAWAVARAGVELEKIRLSVPDFGSPQCGITNEQVHEMLDLLDEKIGPSLTTKLRRRALDMASVVQLRLCTALVRNLSGTPGFKHVANAIRNHPRADLYHPQGAWFQLLVGRVLQFGGHDIEFESLVEGIRKDIVIRPQRVIVECKYFDRAVRSMDRLFHYMRTGTVPESGTDLPKGFDVRSSCIGPIGGGEWVTTNHYQRVTKEIIEKKYRQYVDDWCNIVAINSEYISHGPIGLVEPLQALLSVGQHPKLSGVLLIHRDAMDVSRAKEGPWFCMLLVERNDGVGRPVPLTLNKAIEPWQALPAVQSAAVETGAAEV